MMARRRWPSLEHRLHRGEGDRLVPRHQLSLAIAGGKSCRTQAISPSVTPIRRLAAASSSRPSSVQKAAIPATTKEAVTTEAHMLCAYCHRAHSLSTKSQKLWSCALRPPPGSRPGCCMKALVAMMKYPESTSRGRALPSRLDVRPCQFLLAVEHEAEEGGLEEESEGAFQLAASRQYAGGSSARR